MITQNIELDLAVARRSADMKIVAKVAELIRHHLNLATDRAGRLYWYSNGVYVEDGERAIAEMYQRILQERDQITDWRANMQDNVIKFVMPQAPFVQDKPKLHLLNLNNGVYDWDSAMFLPHSPEYLTTIRIPITYEPSATCEAWDRFLDEVLPYEGGRLFLTEVIGLCMIPLTTIQKSIILVGKGSNGKSTYLNGLMAAVGRDNCCHVPLQRLGDANARFVTSRLLGKLVNVVGDLPARKIDDTSTIKAITGEDSIEGEFKGRNAFRFVPFARLIFACNDVVKSEDDSDGYKRRFIHVPFTQKFAVDPSKGGDLSEALSSPQELSGLLNRIIARLPAIAEDGLTMSQEIASIVDNWVPMPETTANWFKEHIEYDPKGRIPTGGFYNYFNQLCPFDGSRNRGKVITFMKLTFPGVEVGKVVKISGKTVRCYGGVRMKDPVTQKMLELSKANEEEEVTLQ